MKKRSLPALVAALAIAVPMFSCGSQATTTSTASQTANSAANAAVESTVEEGSVRAAYIDVGKGDCILVQSGTSAVLIDTGYKKTASDVLSYLRKQGVKHLDALVLTHYDRDHVGGLRPIAEALSVDAVYLPGYEGGDKNYDETMKTVKDLKLPAQPVTNELRLGLGKAQMTIYPPGVAYVPGTKGDEGNDNDASLVAALSNGNGSYLFAGDLEEEGIDAYLRNHRGQYDVLKMPHHGEKSDNTEDFLDNVRPKIAIITDDIGDPASKKTLKALEKRDVDTYRTSVDGTIVVEDDGTGRYSVSTDGEW